MRLAPGEKEGRARSRFPQHPRERRAGRKAFEISFSISLKNDFAASGEDGGWGMGKRRRRRSCIYAAAASARELVGWEGINIGSCFGLGGGKGLVGWGSTRTNGEGLRKDRGGNFGYSKQREGSGKASRGELLLKTRGRGRDVQYREKKALFSIGGRNL